MASKQPQPPLSEAEAIGAFWDHLKDRSTVMLGLNRPDQHTQPMTAFTEPANEQIWFFTRDDTDLAVQIVTGTDGRLILAAPDQKVFADVLGTFDVRHDQERIDRYWSPMVAAWYPEGKDDPHLTMLCFTPEKGQVWVSKQGLIRLVFEVTKKANITKAPPDVGGTAEVQFKH
jgi:general stress protein 26